MKYLFFILLTLPLYATIWYVDRDATGSGTGTSWTNACNYLDNDGYDTNPTGLEWNNLSAGDTVYISGGSDSTVYRPWNGYGQWIHNENITGGQVVFAPAWQSGHNGDVYFMNSDTVVTYGTWAGQNVESNFSVEGSGGIKFININFIVNEPRPYITSPRSTVINLSSDSLVTFENCHIKTNGVAGAVGMADCALITFENCLIENEYNYISDDNDLFTWSQEGYGQHLIEGNTIINRDAYVGLTDNGTNMTATAGTLTDTDLNMITDYHRHSTISCGASEMIVMSNNNNTFSGTWTGGTPSNGTAWTVNTTAHRDVMQMGYDGIASPRPTTKFINNFIWVLYEGDAISWNQGHYLGDEAAHVSYQNFVYINNLFVFNIQTNNSGNVNIVSQNWPNASSRSKWEFYNNTFITPGGIMISQVIDTFYFKNNLFKVIGGDANYRLLRSDIASFDSIDYNYYSVDNWVDDIYANGGTVMLWDNYNEYTFPQWQSAGFDVNSTRDIDGTLFSGVMDSVATAYATPIALVGTNLSYLAGKYPQILYDINGDLRTTWYMGAVNPTGTLPGTTTRRRVIIIQ